MLRCAQADLFQVVDALQAPRRFSCRLHRRKQEPDQRADDGNDNQQFYQREAALVLKAFHRIDLQRRRKGKMRNGEAVSVTENSRS